MCHVAEEKQKFLFPGAASLVEGQMQANCLDSGRMSKVLLWDGNYKPQENVS